MNSTSTTKLRTLLGRLQTRQRDLITQAAEADTLPPDTALRKIADLENAIGAIELLIEDGKGGSNGGSNG